MSASIWEPGTEITVETNSIVDETTNIAADGQTVVNIATFTYTPGAGLLKVYVNGVRQIPVTDYEETSSSSITFTSGLDAGDRVYLEANISVDVTVVAEAVTLVENIKVDGNNLSIFGDLPIGEAGFSGSNNIGIGDNTFSVGVTTAQNNVFIGYEAGKDSAIDAENSIGIGYRAGYNTSSYLSGNVSVGANTHKGINSATFSVAVGFGSQTSDAAAYETTSDVAIGHSSGAFADFMGLSTCYSSGNVYLGGLAGAIFSGGTNTYTRTNNIAIGYLAGPDSNYTTITNSIAIGYAAQNTASNQAVFGNSSITDTRLFGNVGIGIAPIAKLMSHQAGNSTWLNLSDAIAGIVSASYNGTPANGSAVSVRHGRGSYASPTAVASGDTLGYFRFQAFGGTNTRNIAQISGVVGTYVDDNNISGYLTFDVSAGGASVATPSEIGRAKSNGDWQFGGTNGAHSFEVIKAGGTVVNRLSVTGSATTAAPQLYATGTDTNIDIRITPKGTGVIRFDSTVANGAVACVMTANVGPTGAATAIQGWMKIKDSSGNIRYVPYW